MSLQFIMQSIREAQNVRTYTPTPPDESYNGFAHIIGKIDPGSPMHHLVCAALQVMHRQPYMERATVDPMCGLENCRFGECLWNLLSKHLQLHLIADLAVGLLVPDTPLPLDDILHMSAWEELMGAHMTQVIVECESEGAGIVLSTSEKWKDYEQLTLAEQRVVWEEEEEEQAHKRALAVTAAQAAKTEDKSSQEDGAAAVAAAAPIAATATTARKEDTKSLGFSETFRVDDRVRRKMKKAVEKQMKIDGTDDIVCPLDLTRGARVEVHGLRSAAGLPLNGRRGKLGGPLGATKPDRYPVFFRDQGEKGSYKHIKPCNLRLLTARSSSASVHSSEADAARQRASDGALSLLMSRANESTLGQPVDVVRAMELHTATRVEGDSIADSYARSIALHAPRPKRSDPVFATIRDEIDEICWYRQMWYDVFIDAKHSGVPRVFIPALDEDDHGVWLWAYQWWQEPHLRSKEQRGILEWGEEGSGKPVWQRMDAVGGKFSKTSLVEAKRFGVMARRIAADANTAFEADWSPEVGAFDLRVTLMLGGHWLFTESALKHFEVRHGAVESARYLSMSDEQISKLVNEDITKLLKTRKHDWLVDYREALDATIVDDDGDDDDGVDKYATASLIAKVAAVRASLVYIDVGTVDVLQELRSRAVAHGWVRDKEQKRTWPIALPNYSYGVDWSSTLLEPDRRGHLNPNISNLVQTHPREQRRCAELFDRPECDNKKCPLRGRDCVTHPRPKLRRCASCLTTAYCCVECQRAHWKAGHKHRCKLFKEAYDEKEREERAYYKLYLEK